VSRTDLILKRLLTLHPRLIDLTLDRIERDTDRDRFMSAEEAAEYRLVDKVIERMTVVPQSRKHED